MTDFIMKLKIRNRSILEIISNAKFLILKTYLESDKSEIVIKMTKA